MIESDVRCLARRRGIKTVEVYQTGREGRHRLCLFINNEPLASARRKVRGFATIDAAAKALSDICGAAAPNSSLGIVSWRAEVGRRTGRSQRVNLSTPGRR